jgi:ABC-type sugar transport system ATPase subunit
MDEVFQCCDDVSVLRDGQMILTKKTTETNLDELIKAMVGRSLTNRFPPVDNQPGEDVLEAHLLQGSHYLCLGAETLLFQQGFKGLGQFFLLVVMFHLGLTNEGSDRLSRSGGRYEQRCYFAFICLFWQGSGACSAY